VSLNACVASDAPVAPDPDSVPDPEPLDPVPIVEGSTIGTSTFATGNTSSGGQGQAIAGLDCIVTVAAHYHAHVSLFFEGQQLAIPAAIGITNPTIVNGFVQNGDCFYWLHTHDATGIIHIEPPSASSALTLGQLFDLWGQPLTSDEVAGYRGEISVFVDGLRYTGDPREIVFASRKHISIQVGRPLAPPPMYTFQG
jgi:hypothetical protein